MVHFEFGWDRLAWARPLKAFELGQRLIKARSRVAGDGEIDRTPV